MGGASSGLRFGGLTFHLLGDWRTKENWGAPNTSFEERDGDARLRGYDDHAQVVELQGRGGAPAEKVIRRSYRDLMPLWRYRYRPENEAPIDVLYAEDDSINAELVRPVSQLFISRPQLSLKPLSQCQIKAIISLRLAQALGPVQRAEAQVQI